MGSNTYGQLGTGEKKEHSFDKPVLVKAGDQGAGNLGSVFEDHSGAVTEIAAGLYSSYARTADGRAYAWGLNDAGQLGLEGAPNVDIINGLANEYYEPSWLPT